MNMTQIEFQGSADEQQPLPSAAAGAAYLACGLHELHRGQITAFTFRYDFRYNLFCCVQILAVCFCLLDHL